jgi:hypothetical protein
MQATHLHVRRKHLVKFSPSLQLTTAPWRMIEIKDEKTGGVLSHTRYTDTVTKSN